MFFSIYYDQLFVNLAINNILKIIVINKYTYLSPQEKNGSKSRTKDESRRT